LSFCPTYFVWSFPKCGRLYPRMPSCWCSLFLALGINFILTWAWWSLYSPKDHVPRSTSCLTSDQFIEWLSSRSDQREVSLGWRSFN
jgi:hypothetical protein